ncbi:hypothetical protein [Methyloligella solikamskensis]|uniref:Secreted peptide n=1 Tax=Methyloligella solikamskensis TaxID=1177756 RepID=A0ABW3J8I7_9HYPH
MVFFSVVIFGVVILGVVLTRAITVSMRRAITGCAAMRSIATLRLTVTRFVVIWLAVARPHRLLP